jgi:hypothetical protein
METDERRVIRAVVWIFAFAVVFLAGYLFGTAEWVVFVISAVRKFLFGS